MIKLVNGLTNLVKLFEPFVNRERFNKIKDIHVVTAWTVRTIPIL